MERFEGVVNADGTLTGQEYRTLQCGCSESRCLYGYNGAGAWVIMERCEYHESVEQLSAGGRYTIAALENAEKMSKLGYDEVALMMYYMAVGAYTVIMREGKNKQEIEFLNECLKKQYRLIPAGAHLVCNNKIISNS